MPRGLPDAADLAVVIAAGGEATRFPQKLERHVLGEPLLLRVYRNVRALGPVYVSASRSFEARIDASLDCPVVVDRTPRRGPLGGLYTTFGVVRAPRIFVVAGDAPLAGEGVLRELLAAWEPGLEAAVPRNASDCWEPLCALYDRLAFLREAAPLWAEGGGVSAVVDRLRVKAVRLQDERALANINTPREMENLPL